MDETTAVAAFNPRTVQQALHVLRGRERKPEVEGLLCDLQQLAQTLAELGCRQSDDISPRRAHGITQGPGHAILKRAAKFFYERQLGHLDIANALDLQANAIREFAGSG